MGAAVSIHINKGPHKFFQPIINSNPDFSLSDIEDLETETEITLPNCAETPENIDEYSAVTDDILGIFEYRKLKKATNDFSDGCVLGEGGFGKVYKGWLKNADSGSRYPVAIKKLSSGGSQGQCEWTTELLSLGQLHHPNLVKLLGFCAENGNLFLVYEYLPGGSLECHLFPVNQFNNPVPSSLSIAMRLKIALGMAKGLAYIHKKRFVHRDFKTSNVLLDEDFNAKVSDFGFARIIDREVSESSTKVMGTLGYLDPLFFRTGKLSFKSDVYSFGVILLELITGQHAVDKHRNQPLISWSKPFLSPIPDIEQLLDPAIKQSVLENYVASEVVTRLAVVAKYCVEYEKKCRPTMDEVVHALKILIHYFVTRGQ